MKNKARKILPGALIFILSAISIAAQNKISVRVFAETKVENDAVKLGDIAQISGGDAERVEKLKNVSLGYAPNVGMSRELARERLVLAIAAAGFTWGDFSFAAPPTIRLHRAGQEISRTQLGETVEKAVSDLFAGKDISVKILRIDLPAKIEIPVGEIDARVNFAGVRNYFAAFSAPIEIRVNNTVVRRLAANVEIEAFADVLVAVKDLAANEKIGEADVRAENRRLIKPPASYLRDAKNLRGLKLIKNVSGGAEITADSLVADTVVRFGDQVRIVGQSGKLQISVSGEARANGKIGDRIAVKNSQSKAILQAVVVDEGLVKVIFLIL